MCWLRDWGGQCEPGLMEEKILKRMGKCARHIDTNIVTHTMLRRRITKSFVEKSGWDCSNAPWGRMEGRFCTCDLTIVWDIYQS